MVRELCSVRETTGPFPVAESHLPTAPCPYHRPNPCLGPSLSAAVISFHQPCLLARTASPSFSLPLSCLDLLHSLSHIWFLPPLQTAAHPSTLQRSKVKTNKQTNKTDTVTLGELLGLSLATISLSNEHNDDTFPPELWSEILLRKPLAQLLLGGYFPATAAHHSELGLFKTMA